MVVLVSTSPCFCLLCAMFVALHGLEWGASAKKFALHAQNTPKSAFLRLQGELFRGRADEGAVLGEVFRGWGVGGVCRANFVSGRLGWNRTGRVPSHRQSGTPHCLATVVSDRTGNQFAGPATARHKRMGMKKALPKERFVEMQNPHRWIAPRGAAARPEGLEPPTF